jgi:hypothetical protein
MPKGDLGRGRLRLHLAVAIHGTQLDRKLAQGADPTESQELALRARQLSAVRMRRSLAKGIERVIAQAERYSESAALPINREEVVRSSPLLLRLAARLRAPENVSPCGIAIVRLLLTEDTSPIMSPGWSRATAAPGALEEKARVSLAALDRQPGIPPPRTPPF